MSINPVIPLLLILRITQNLNQIRAYYRIFRHWMNTHNAVNTKFK